MTRPTSPPTCNLVMITELWWGLYIQFLVYHECGEVGSEGPLQGVVPVAGLAQQHPLVRRWSLVTSLQPPRRQQVAAGIGSIQVWTTCSDRTIPDHPQDFLPRRLFLTTKSVENCHVVPIGSAGWDHGIVSIPENPLPLSKNIFILKLGILANQTPPRKGPQIKPLLMALCW